MSTYYSIIFVTLKPATMERLSIGLLLFDKQNVYYKFSNSKLGVIKSLLGKDAHKSVSDTLKTIGFKSYEDNSNISHTRGFKLLKNVEVDISFTNTYVNYLSRYKNNLINYSEPKEIDIAVNDVNLLKLFKNYIGDIISEEKVSVLNEELDPLRVFKQSFDLKVHNHFLEGRTITNIDVPNLLVPVQIDLVGRNGIDVFVQTIDTHSQPSTIIKDISTFYLLKETYRKNNQPIKDFLLSKEPPQNMKKQHDLWMNIRKSNEFNYVDLSEAQVIIDYAEEHDVKPFFREVDNDDSHSLPF